MLVYNSILFLELLLEYTSTVLGQEKGQIQEQLRMYEALWEEHPRVKQIRAESEAKGKEEGIARWLLSASM